MPNKRVYPRKAVLERYLDFLVRKLIARARIEEKSSSESHLGTVEEYGIYLTIRKETHDPDQT